MLNQNDYLGRWVHCDCQRRLQEGVQMPYDRLTSQYKFHYPMDTVE